MLKMFEQREERDTGDAPGQEPLVDVAMASREFRFSVAAPLRDAPRAITITRLADGATQAVGADAPELLEAQLRALLLEDDGQLAVQARGLCCGSCCLFLSVPVTIRMILSFAFVLQT
jgi:hypothetical protein